MKPKVSTLHWNFNYPTKEDLEGFENNPALVDTIVLGNYTTISRVDSSQELLMFDKDEFVRYAILQEEEKPLSYANLAISKGEDTEKGTVFLEMGYPGIISLKVHGRTLVETTHKWNAMIKALPKGNTKPEPEPKTKSRGTSGKSRKS